MPSLELLSMMLAHMIQIAAGSTICGPWTIAESRKSRSATCRVHGRAAYISGWNLNALYRFDRALDWLRVQTEPAECKEPYRSKLRSVPASKPYLQVGM